MQHAGQSHELPSTFETEASGRLSHVPDKAWGGLHSENMVGVIAGTKAWYLCSFPQTA